MKGTRKEKRLDAEGTETVGLVSAVAIGEARWSALGHRPFKDQVRGSVCATDGTQ
jgi:hypothetical protein